MGAMNRQTRMRKAAVLSILPVTVVGLAGCNGAEETDPPAAEDIYIDNQEESDDTLDSGPYDEVFDQSFYDELNIYFGEEVTLAASVDETLSAHAFTLDGADEAAIEPLLVVHAEELTDLDPGSPVTLTGQVYEYFDLATVEEELGVDLNDSLYGERENEPYLLASAVEAAPTPTP